MNQIAERNRRRHHQAMLNHRAHDDARITHCPGCDDWCWEGQCSNCGTRTKEAS